MSHFNIFTEVQHSQYFSFFHVLSPRIQLSHFSISLSKFLYFQNTFYLHFILFVTNFHWCPSRPFHLLWLLMSPVSGANWLKPVEKQGVKHDVYCTIFVKGDCNATLVSSGLRLARGANASIALQSSNNNWPLDHNYISDLLALRTAIAVNEITSHTYTYACHTVNEKHPF